MGRRNKKVLLVSEYFYPHWTGIAQTFFYIAESLQKQGYGVTVLTTQFDRSLPRRDKVGRTHIIRTPYQFRVSRTHYSISALFSFISLVPRHSTVIINSPHSNVLFFSIITRLFRRKLVIFHQGDIVMPRETGSQLINWLLERIFDAMTIPSMWLAHAVGTFTRDYSRSSRVMRYFGNKVFTYIPAVRLSTKPPIIGFRHKMTKLEEKYVLIGIAGRFVEEKGFDVFFRALPLIKKLIPRAHIVFAGMQKLDYEPYYEKHAKLFEKHSDDVTFLGLLKDGDYAHFYDKLDVFVLPSRTECLALTQLEALQKHVPIVVSDTPGARMIVKHSGFGVIVPIGDSKALADAIADVLVNHTSYLKNHRKAVSYVSAREKLPLSRIV